MLVGNVSMQRIEAIEIIIHEDYEIGDSIKNDICLLKLDDELEFNEYVRITLFPLLHYNYQFYCSYVQPAQLPEQGQVCSTTLNEHYLITPHISCLRCSLLVWKPEHPAGALLELLRTAGSMT